MTKLTRHRHANHSDKLGGWTIDYEIRGPKGSVVFRVDSNPRLDPGPVEWHSKEPMSDVNSIDSERCRWTGAACYAYYSHLAGYSTKMIYDEHGESALYRCLIDDYTSQWGEAPVEEPLTLAPTPRSIEFSMKDMTPQRAQRLEEACAELVETINAYLRQRDG